MLDAGCWMLDTGYWMLDIGPRRLRGRLLDIGVWGLEFGVLEQALKPGRRSLILLFLISYFSFFHSCASLQTKHTNEEHEDYRYWKNGPAINGFHFHIFKFSSSFPTTRPGD